MSHAALYTARGSHVIPTLLAGLHVTWIYYTGHYYTIHKLAGLLA